MRRKRTSNMELMVVTLEVLKLSGWLKASAEWPGVRVKVAWTYCRVEGRACDSGGRGASREAGGSGVVAAHKRHARGEGPTQGLGAKGTRGARSAHVEHVAHVRDAGGVKAQRLVEGRCVLPSRREGHAMREGEVRAGRREGLWCGCGTTRGMQGEKAQLKAWGPRARAERAR